MTDGNEYINLSNGDIVEFFVRPTDTYLQIIIVKIYFLLIGQTSSRKSSYCTDTNTNNRIQYNRQLIFRNENTIYVGPGEEAVTLPSGEIKVYVTTVYVQAPASKFSSFSDSYA